MLWGARVLWAEAWPQGAASSQGPWLWMGPCFVEVRGREGTLDEGWPQVTSLPL